MSWKKLMTLMLDGKDEQRREIDRKLERKATISFKRTRFSMQNIFYQPWFWSSRIYQNFLWSSRPLVGTFHGYLELIPWESFLVVSCLNSGSNGKWKSMEDCKRNFEKIVVWWRHSSKQGWNENFAHSVTLKDWIVLQKIQGRFVVDPKKFQLWGKVLNVVRSLV